MNFFNIFKLLRIDHWIKNIFALIGSFCALKYFDVSLTINIFFMILLALLLSCMMSLVNYLMNEILDAPFDKNHPTKQFRPIPMGQVNPLTVWFLSFCLFVFVMILSFLFFNLRVSISLALLYGAGLLYNIPPIRLKDRNYLDVISESVNNPIRLCIGWFAISEVVNGPPIILGLLFWAFGAFLMTSKRCAELRHLKEDAARYRPTFKNYSEKKLSYVLIIYSAISFSLFILLTIQFDMRLLWIYPFFVLFFIWFLTLTFQKNSVVMHPEKIFKKPWFVLYGIGLLCILFLIT